MDADPQRDGSGDPGDPGGGAEHAPARERAGPGLPADVGHEGPALVAVTMAHVTLGALVLALTVLGALFVVKNVRRAEAPEESQFRQVSAV